MNNQLAYLQQAAMLVLLLTITSIAQDVKKQPTAEELVVVARQAGSIMNKYCFRCHRGIGSTTGSYAFNARDVASMIEGSVPVIVAGNADSSEVYDAMHDGRMPPKNQASLPRPTGAEQQIIRKWIEAGARAFPKPDRRAYVSLKDTMEAIYAHVGKLEPRVRQDYRYFTLVNLHNDPGVDNRQIRLAHAALAKAINSLSWRPDLVVPDVIGKENTVLAVDISKLGWTDDHWNAISQEYPYDVDFEAIGDSRIEQIHSDLKKLAHSPDDSLMVRADWFVSIGLRPKLYHQLLYDLVLPDLRKRPIDKSNPSNPKSMTDLDLESYLKLDVAASIFARRPQAVRAGYSESGISGQNRMIERHPLKSGGYYWKSYDFLGSNSRAVLSEFPLGPIIAQNPYTDIAFKHDGGEIIFSLPNGLQGYLLASAKGARLDAGPIEIVGDALKTSGNQLIVNALSCVVCHKNGMVEPPRDEIRDSASRHKALRDKINDLYVDDSEMKKLIESDIDSFSTKTSKLLKPIQLKGDDASEGISTLEEPVGATSRRYLLEPMNLDTVACELHIREAAQIKPLLENDARVRRLGLGILSRENGTIKREVWQHFEGSRTLMQVATTVLGYAKE